MPSSSKHLTKELKQYTNLNLNKGISYRMFTSIGVSGTFDLARGRHSSFRSDLVVTKIY